MMATKAADFREHFNDVAEEHQRHAVFVRAIEFQMDSSKRLLALSEECKDLKEQAIAAGQEYDSNAFLCFEFMAQSLHQELEFYIALKNDDPDKAWNHLINAQQHACCAMRAHEFASHLEPYVERLHILERALFPVTIFFSTGMIVKQSQCSICGVAFGECDHIKGRAYMGKLCSRIVTEADLLEVSVVTDPADKHCRVLSFSEGEVTRNAFTLREIEAGKPRIA